jgi:hypothetical protein
MKRGLIIRYSIIAISTSAAVAVGVFFATDSIPRTYQASATLAAQRFTDDSSIAAGLGLSPAVASHNEESVPYMLNGKVGLRAIIANVARQLPGHTVEQIKSSVSIADATDIDTATGRQYTNAGLRILGVKAVANSPHSAAQTATTFAREFVAYRRALVRILADRYRALLTERLKSTSFANGPARTALLNRLDELNDAAAIAQAQVQFRTPADEAGSRISPYAARDAVTAALLVLLVALLLHLLARQRSSQQSKPLAIDNGA